MADEKSVKKCENPVCTCPALPNSDYCSASCEGIGDIIEIDCECGHEACEGNI